MVKELLHMTCQVESPFLESQAKSTSEQSCWTAGHVVSLCGLGCGKDSIFLIEYFHGLASAGKAVWGSDRSGWGNSASNKSFLSLILSCQVS